MSHVKAVISDKTLLPAAEEGSQSMLPDSSLEIFDGSDSVVVSERAKAAGIK